MEKPLVSICCLVYNHEPFLRECFEGFVMQKTTFPIEVLVHDDASTDHSVDIIREYTEKYPDIFKPYYQTENQYSKGKGFVGLQINFERAQGKYIAMCEGDDYWTDPLKLQKQVDFLEGNEDYAMCFHNVKIWKQNENILVDDFITKEVPVVTDIYELAKGNYIHTPSVVIRNNPNIISKYSKLENLRVGDYPLWMLTALYGKLYKHSDHMSIYRYGSGVWTSKKKHSNVEHWIDMLIQLSINISNDKAQKILKEQIINIFGQLQNNYDSVLNSHAFKLGDFMLKPIYTLKKHYTKILSAITKSYAKPHI